MRVLQCCGCARPAAIELALSSSSGSHAPLPSSFEIQCTRGLQCAKEPSSRAPSSTSLTTCLSASPPSPPNADVAFTKHSTVLEVPTDGSSPASWANKKKLRPVYFTVLFTVARCDMCM